MVIQDQFIDNLNVNASDAGNLPLYLIKGLSEKTLELPEGLSLDYAFQSVQRNVPSTAQTQVTVDGLRASLDCQPVVAALPRDLLRVHYDNSENLSINYKEPIKFSFTSPGCNIKSVEFSGPLFPFPGWTNNSVNMIYSQFSATECDEPAPNTTEGRRIVVLVANLTFSPDRSFSPDSEGYYPLRTNLGNSTSMLCVPSYTISKVNVIRKDTRTLVVPSMQNSSRSSNSLSAWGLADAQFSAYRAPSAVTWAQRLDSSGCAMDLDIHIQAVAATQLASNTPATRLFEFDFLQSLIANYHRQITAIIIKSSLMTPASLNTTGVYILSEDRLIMRTWAAQWMAGLLAGCIILTTVILVLIPSQGLLPRNPASSILSLAALLNQSRDLIARVRFLGAADRKNLVRFLQPYTYSTDSTGAHDHFVIREHLHPHSYQKHHRISPQMQSKQSHPALLHPTSRLALGFILIALIIALELMLRKSISEDGLGDVGDGDDTFIHYTWTTIPALVFGALALAFAVVDFQTRSITPYTTLQSTTNTEAFMHSALLDMSFPRIIYREIKLRNMGALAGSTALLLSSVFTIFSGSLFQPLSLPTINLIHLHPTTSFDSDMWVDNPTASLPAIWLSSLILASNLSYPKFTYGDLAFPVLEPATLPTSGLNASSIVTVMPELSGRLDCRAYPMSKIKIEPAYDVKDTTIADDKDFKNPFGVIIDDEGCALWQHKYNDLLPPGPDSGYEYFGQARQGGNFFTGVAGCSQLVYYWGKYSSSPGPKPMQYAAGMGCNVTFELVDVETTFLSTNLDLDPDNPPRPRQGTARPSPIASENLIKLQLYLGLAQRATTQYLDPFFSLLTFSPCAIPTFYLGNASTSEAVMEAIKLQHGIIQAQMFRLGWGMVPDEGESSSSGGGVNENGIRSFGIYYEVVGKGGEGEDESEMG